jgi:dipeptidyl aminopeptidase/acylaminoacyl peptidase
MTNIYTSPQSNGGTILNRVNIKTKKVEALSSSDIGVSSFDLANNTVVYAKTEVANPSELYFANTDFKKQRKGSDFNGWVGNKKLSFLKRRPYQ